jgi:hypothetical protein
MSKVKVTIEGDMKFAGYIYGMLTAIIESNQSPLTKATPIHFDDKTKISFEMESRI